MDDALTPARLVHYFDTRQRRILCGAAGLDLRSTKHARTVTCEACIGLLRDRLAASAAGPEPVAAP